MKVLILHRIPYRKILYEQCLDHQFHEVTYIGTPQKLIEIPADLPCHKVEIRDDSSLVSEIIRFAESQSPRFDAFLSLSEVDLLAAAEIRQRLNMPDGPWPEEIHRVRDKVAMKEALNKAKVRTPRFLSYSEWQKGRGATWSGPSILKPLSESGSEGVEKFDSPKAAIARWKDLSNGSSHQLEEFIAGRILHADGLVRNGKLLEFVTSEYVGTCLDYAHGAPIGSFQRIKNSNEIEHFVQSCLKALRMKAGAFHLEFFETITPGNRKRRYVFLEIAHRIGGGDIIRCFEMKTGYHLPTMEVSLWLEVTAKRKGLSEDLKRIRKRMKHRRPHSPNESFAFILFPSHTLTSSYTGVKLADWVYHDSEIFEVRTLSKHQKPISTITYHDWEVPAAFLIRSTSARSIRKKMLRCFKAVTIYS